MSVIVKKELKIQSHVNQYWDRTRHRIWLWYHRHKKFQSFYMKVNQVKYINVNIDMSLYMMYLILKITCKNSKIRVESAYRTFVTKYNPFVYLIDNQLYQQQTFIFSGFYVSGNRQWQTISKTYLNCIHIKLIICKNLTKRKKFQ